MSTPDDELPPTSTVDHTPSPTPSGHNVYAIISLSNAPSAIPSLEWRQAPDMVAVKAHGQILGELPWDEFVSRLLWLFQERERVRAQYGDDKR